jgi:predicted nucleotidyltransferase
MLRSDEILDFLKQHKEDLETRFSVRRIGLFGSVLRGSASDRSDVDILV